MKFCPYCGASLVGGAVSFCAECGRSLPEQPDRPDHARPPVSGKGKAPRILPNPQDENYDGYYDDVPPIDADRVGERLDPVLVRQIVLLVLGAAGLITLSAALLTLL